MTGELYITDGTTRINLLTGIDGFYMQSWNPSIAGRKATFRDSPLSDGRKPALMKWSNATENMSFHVGRFAQDDVIADTQDLRRLLLKAEEYFFGVNDTPVWLVARGDCETNTRYAPIVTWGTGNDSDPYHKPFDLDNPVMSPWTLILERQHWRDVAPGSSTCVQLSATQAYYDEQAANFEPAASDDDCYVDGVGGTITLNGNLRFGVTGGSAAIYGSGIRFKSVTVPVGALITRAHVTLVADANLGGNNVNVIIRCNDEDDAATFTTFANFVGRARTTANTLWSAIPAWASLTSYSTPDIGPAVQEVVARAGWASGNSIAVLFDDNTSTAGATRTAHSLDTAHNPILVINWFDATTRTFGRTATCNNEVYVANKHNMAQLTHAYHYTAATATFSANLIGAALPLNLLPAVPAANDIVYFGISTVAVNSGPFCSLVFDIGTAQVDLTQIDWQYYDSVAAAWHALTVQDNTNAAGLGTGDPFDTTGVRSVHWEPPDGAAHNWGTTTVNGVLGYWVRALVSAVGGAPATPTQQNRDIYTIVTPYIDTLASQVKGDITALAQHYLYSQSGGGTSLRITKVLQGLRTYSRGSLFTSYLNLSDEQNQTGLTVTKNAAASFTWVNDNTAPSGRAIDMTTAGALGGYFCYITFSSTLASHYIGEFRCFLRVKVITAASVGIALSLCVGDYTNIVRQTDYKYAPATSAFFQYLDFGKIKLPPIPHDLGNTYDSVILRLDENTSVASNWRFYDLIIIPADECLIDTSATVLPGGTYSSYESLDRLPGYRLNLDSTIPRRFIVTDLQNATTGATFAPWRGAAANPNIMQPNERQRWWYFFHGVITGNTGPNPADAVSAQAFQVSRYLSMRGKR